MNFFNVHAFSVSLFVFFVLILSGNQRSTYLEGGWVGGITLSSMVEIDPPVDRKKLEKITFSCTSTHWRSNASGVGYSAPTPAAFLTEPPISRYLFYVRQHQTLADN